MLRISGLVSYLLLLAFSLQGQSSVNTAISQGVRSGSVLDIFHERLPDYQAHKIHGRTYFNPHPGIEDHQFFRTRNLSKAKIWFREDTLNCDFTTYDISRDKLIVFSAHSSSFVELEEEFISSFIIGIPEDQYTYGFINSPYIGGFPENLPRGFYQKVYDGSGIGMLLRHEKIHTEVARANVYIPVFKKKEQLILKMDHSYSLIRKKKDLMSHFPGHEKQIRKHLRESKLNIKAAGIEQLKALGKYLNELDK